MCLMNPVRWSDWTGKATERSSETTQREVDGIAGIRMWRAPERARGGGVMSWVRRRRRGRVSSAGSEEDDARTAQQEKGHKSKAGEGTQEQSSRRRQQHTRKQNMTNRKGNHD